MNITIISVGKIKEKYIKLGIEEFSKRLSRYSKINFIEVSDEKAPENLSEIEMQMVKNKEGESITKHIKDGTFTIALVIKGEMLTSEEMAHKFKELALEGNSHVTFIIGGSLGLSDDIIKKANFKLSFSPMTFPHQLMKLILLEQIYRGFRIIKGEPYHK